jgi:hypothetical protein
VWNWRQQRADIHQDLLLEYVSYAISSRDETANGNEIQEKTENQRALLIQSISVLARLKMDHQLKFLLPSEEETCDIETVSGNKLIKTSQKK